MSRIDVLYNPTVTNTRVVRKLRTLPLVDVAEFTPVDVRDWMRTRELTAAKGRYAYIWGCGYDHGESYYVTRGAVKGKIGIDACADDEYRGRVYYDSHMGNTALDGIRVVTAVDSAQKLRAALEFGRTFNDGELGITVDGCGIHAFPALSHLVNPDGVDSEQVATLLRNLGRRVSRLDIGGIIEDMPEVTLVDRIPNYQETLEVVSRWQMRARLPFDSTEQDKADSVFSHAIRTYAIILNVFIQHCCHGS